VLRIKAMRILTVIGNRPQFVKAAAVSAPLRERHEEVLVHTGQHHDDELSAVFVRELGVPPPDRELGISGGSNTSQTSRMMDALEPVIADVEPDLALVYGDTNSTLAGALAAAQHDLPVAHVEAGMRSFDRAMPEEVNRVLTDHLSTWLFCPSADAEHNLAQEGIRKGVHLVGDVMYDVLLCHLPRAMKHQSLLRSRGLQSGSYALATIHRAENTDDPNRLNQICDALNEIQKGIQVVLPLHPRTRATLKSQNINLLAKVIDPVGYFDMLALLEHCRLVMTDSGGLQKEAYFFNKFCLTLRDQTEWVELVEAQANFIVGADKNQIIKHFHELLNKNFPPQNAMYGKGNAAGVIVENLRLKIKD